MHHKHQKPPLLCRKEGAGEKVKDAFWQSRVKFSIESKRSIRKRCWCIFKPAPFQNCDAALKIASQTSEDNTHIQYIIPSNHYGWGETKNFSSMSKHRKRYVVPKVSLQKKNKPSKGRHQNWVNLPKAQWMQLHTARLPILSPPLLRNKSEPIKSEALGLEYKTEIWMLVVLKLYMSGKKIMSGKCINRARQCSLEPWQERKLYSQSRL